MFELLHQHEFFWLFLAIASFLTGIVASIGGAGGLIIMPFMIGSGIPPQVAVATAKFSSFGMWAIVLMRFNKAKLIAWRYVVTMCILAAIGGVLGANIAIAIDSNVMIFTIGVLFFIIGLISLLNPDYGVIERKVSRFKIYCGFALYLAVITLSGFFPAGMSILIIFCLVTFMGLNALQAHATDILPWIVQTITSTTVYIMHDMVDFTLALSLFVGLALGGQIGSKIAVRQGAKFIKLFISILAVIIGVYWIYAYGKIIIGNTE